jgi:L-ascorbate metabolism protein UlaG (beta-lactamase superfamily)
LDQAHPPERAFGSELAHALATGHAWLADEQRIRQLLTLTLEPNANTDLIATLRQVQEKPIHIYFRDGLGSMFAVAPYQLRSLDDLKNKLSQYPAGTHFVWSDRRQATSRFEFYGHNAFKVTSPAGLTVLTDPWRNDSTGFYPKWFRSEFPAIRVDIVLSTHAHFDHDAVARPKALMVLERLIGQFKLGDIEITGLADKHKCEPPPVDKPQSASSNLHVETCPPNNVLAFDNAIDLIETGGLRIVIWGDNRAAPDPFLDHYLKNVDVLILPIESILTRAEVDAIVGKYDPKAVIPAHYYVAGLTTDVSGLESADGWANYQEKVRYANVRRLDSAHLTLNAAKLKGSHHRVYYFGNHFEEK